MKRELEIPESVNRIIKRVVEFEATTDRISEAIGQQKFFLERTRDITDRYGIRISSIMQTPWVEFMNGEDRIELAVQHRLGPRNGKPRGSVLFRDEATKAQYGDKGKEILYTEWMRVRKWNKKNMDVSDFSDVVGMLEFIEELLRKKFGNTTAKG